MKAAVLTVSDSVHEGTRADDSGDTLADLLTGAGFEVARSVVPDEPDAIEACAPRDWQPRLALC